MVKDYDVSWDNDDDHDSFEEKYREWEKRSWKVWLSENPGFPFEVGRMEDEDETYFTDIAKTEPFCLGHNMLITGSKVRTNCSELSSTPKSVRSRVMFRCAIWK